MLTVLLSLAALCGSQATPAASPAPQSVTALTVSPAAPLVEFDLRRLKGQLVRELAWSPDQTELYLQTYDANRDASIKTRYHYLIPVAGGAPAAVDAPPGWAVAYHQWKSAQASPADADRKSVV